MTTLPKTHRLRGLDTLRGFTILSMIAFHTCWDLMYCNMGITEEFLYGRAAYFWQQSICYSFILISGYCFVFGHHHVKRALYALSGGILITIVTCLFMYDARDIFGILIFLGSATIIMIPIDKILPRKRMVSILGLIVSFVLFLLFRNVNRGFLGFEGINFCRISQELYKNYLTTYFGFCHEGFYSSDYFSILPWFFLYAFGYFLSRIMHMGRFEEIVFSKGIEPLEVIGRHSLIIYMLHQPVAYGLIRLLSLYFD